MNGATIEFLLNGLHIIPEQLALVEQILSLEQLHPTKLSVFGYNSRGDSHIELAAIASAQEFYGPTNLEAYLQGAGLPRARWNNECDVGTSDKNTRIIYQLDADHRLTLKVFPPGRDPSLL
jgi:hypothetical protein